MSATKGSFAYTERDDVSREAELSDSPIFLYTHVTREFVLVDPTATLKEVAEVRGLSGADKALHLCRSANKDFSIIALGGFVPPDVANSIREARRQAVIGQFEHRLEKSFIRKGADGREHIPATPETVLFFSHIYSYAKVGDAIHVFPHDHHHAIKSGTCRTADGRTGQDASLRNNWFRTQATDRAEDLKRQETILNDNGIRTERRGNNFIVPEIPRDFVGRMSPGSERIREAIRELGFQHTPLAADIAARLREDRGRMPTAEIPTLEEARREWQVLAKLYSFERVEVREPLPRLSENDAKFAAAAVVKQSVLQLHAQSGTAGFSPVQLKQAALENSLGVHGLTADQVIAEVRLAYQRPKTHGLERGRLDSGEPVLRIAHPLQGPGGRSGDQARETGLRIATEVETRETSPGRNQSDEKKAEPITQRSTVRGRDDRKTPSSSFQPQRPEQKDHDQRRDNPRPEYVLDAKDYRAIDRFLRDHDRRTYIERAAKSIVLGISQQWGDLNRGLAFGEHLYRQYTRDNGRQLPPVTVVVVKNSHYLNPGQTRRLKQLVKRQDVSLRLQFQEATFQQARDRQPQKELER